MKRRVTVFRLCICAAVVFFALGRLVVGEERNDPPRCDSEITVIPQEIAVYNLNDSMNTRALVFLTPDNRLNQKRKFTLALTELGKESTPITRTVTTLAPVLGGTKISFVVDVAPHLLAVAPNQAEMQPSYYFALVLENILDRFGLKGDLQGQDYGSIWLPSMQRDGAIQANSPASRLFEFAVSNLPLVASLDGQYTHKQVTNKILSALDPASAAMPDLPQMLVLVRWRDEPFGQDEYFQEIKAKLESWKEDNPSALPVSILVVDVGQGATPSIKTDAGIVVASLGSLAATYPVPEPYFVGWSVYREEFRETDVMRTLRSAIEQAREPVHRRFLIDIGWRAVVVGEQADALQLTVSTELDDEKKPIVTCSRKLVFPAPEDQDHLTWQQTVLRSLALVATVFTVVSTAVLLTPWLLILAAEVAKNRSG